MTAAYIINNLPTPVIENKTPHEIILKKIPSYEHFKVFVFLAYSHDDMKPGDMFDEWLQPCVIGQKGYRLYDLKNQKVYTT